MEVADGREGYAGGHERVVQGIWRALTSVLVLCGGDSADDTPLIAVVYTTSMPESGH